MATMQHSGLLNLVKILLLVITLSVTSHGIFGKPICKYNEFVLEDMFGNKTCFPCRSCPSGFGLTPQCGSTIKYGSYFKCEPCQSGVTYSSTNDISSCKPCGICTDHMTRISKCTPTQNSKCGKSCERGFYYSDVTMDCQECSWCCKGSFLSPEKDCQGKDIPFYKQCSANDGSFCEPRCSDKEFVVVDEKLNHTCIKCPNCPIGTGLHPKCSSVLTDPNKAKCTQCIPGKTYSDASDSSMCKICTTCEVGKKIERTCNTTHDTLCGDCVHGFYNDNKKQTVDNKKQTVDDKKQTDDKVECKACSFCCEDELDVRVTECIDQGMPTNQQCAYTERAVRKCQQKQPKKGLVIILLITFSLLLVVMGIVISCAWYHCKNRNPYEQFGKEVCESTEGEMYSKCIIVKEKPSKDSRPNYICFTHSNAKIICNDNDYVGMEIINRVSLELCTDTLTHTSINIKEDEVLLSPVFKFHIDGGPLHMKNQVQLNLFHSAFVESEEGNNWSISVLKSNESHSSSQAPSEWTNLGDFKNIVTEKGWVEFLDQDLGSYVVVGTPGQDKKLSKKRMCCVVFGDAEPRIGSTYSTSLYLLDDCPSIKKLAAEEEQFGRKQVQGPHPIYPDTHPKSTVSVEIDVSSQGWTVNYNPKIIHSSDWLASYMKTPKVEATFSHQEPFDKDFKCCFKVNLNNEKVLEIPVWQYVGSYSTQASDCALPQNIASMTPVTTPHQDASNGMSKEVSPNHAEIKEALTSAHIDNNPERMEQIVHILFPQSKDSSQLILQSADPSTALSDMIERQQVTYEDLSAAFKSLPESHQPECPEDDESAAKNPLIYPEGTNLMV